MATYGREKTLSLSRTFFVPLGTFLFLLEQILFTKILDSIRKIYFNLIPSQDEEEQQQCLSPIKSTFYHKRP